MADAKLDPAETALVLIEFQVSAAAALQHARQPG
jgi:hypothetical protein